MNVNHQSNANHAQTSLLQSVASIPRKDNEPVFHEPWQAEVFAMTLTLYDSGLFTWPEWAEELSQEISRANAAGEADLGDTYYHHWLCALESILIKKNVGSRNQLTSLYQRWDEAAQSTPHGQAIILSD